MRVFIVLALAVTVVTQRHGTLAPYEVHQQIPIHRVFAFSAGHLASGSYLVSSFLWMLKNRHSFQIIHANRSSSGLVAGLIGFVLRKRVLYKLTRGDEVDTKGFRSTWFGRFKAHLLRKTVDKFVAITEEIENALQQIGIPAEKVVRIANGMTLDDFSRRYDRACIKSELDWSVQAIVVLVA
jgi:glycosyltransferase involved in cell wall biosynthesis